MNYDPFTIRAVAPEDALAVTEIFNYFALHSMAVYTDKPAGSELFAMFSKSARSFVVLEKEKTVIGFGLIQHFREYETFSHTGVLTYFILPEYTGKGLGSRLLSYLTEEAQKLGIVTLIAHISSLNSQSLNFHKKHGFQECGRLARTGFKFKQYFDVVWVQKCV